jgi:hypothetical protein
MPDGSGAAYVGMPGSCSQKDVHNPGGVKTYGSFDKFPDHEHILHFKD